MNISENQFQELEQNQEQEAKETERIAHWYAVQVASGCEKRVKTNLEQRIRTLDVTDRIFQVQIPQSSIVKVRKDGSRQHGEEKVFPGYVLVYMVMDDDAWQVVKNTPNVINFVGAEQKRHYGRGRGHVTPVPLSPSEVERIFKQAQEQEPIVKFDMEVGDKILVLSGPFKDFEGEVIEVSPERSKLKALLSIFGRDTPVELEFNQIEKKKLTMAKKIVAVIKLALPAGKANPAPPVGPALGQHGVNIMMFCKEYNAKTADQAGMVVPVEISVYEDRSFTFILKTPPASVLIRKAAGVEKEAQMNPTKKIVGSITRDQLREIAQTKMPDLNANDIEAAMNIVAGTARNMGVSIKD